MPRALKQSAAPVEVVLPGQEPLVGLAQEYGARVPVGSTQQRLQVRRKPVRFNPNYVCAWPCHAVM